MNREKIREKIESSARNLSESSLSRIWQHVEEDDRSFAVIAAGRPEYSENEIEERYGNLKQDVRDMGYGYIEMLGGWKDDDGVVIEEPSLFIPEIARRDAINLGEKYEQDSILYKGDDAFEEISTRGNVGSVLNHFEMHSGADNMTLKKDMVKDFFSSLLKGSHAGKRFLFQIKEKEQGSVNRMAYHDEPLKWKVIFEEEVEIGE